MAFRLGIVLLAMAALSCTKLLGDFKIGSSPPEAGPSDILVSPTSALVTTEWGGKATFTLVLNVAPTSNVAIALQSNNGAEGFVRPESVTFTPENWKAPQTVTVTGVDDGMMDGTKTYTIVTAQAVSEDSHYNSMDPPDVSVTNIDGQTPGLTVLSATGLTTSEGGGQATFTVALNAPPRESVTVDLTSNNPNEGTVSPPSLTFTTSNFRAPQTVTVTGADDMAVDGPQVYRIMTAAARSMDRDYEGVDGADVEITNVDDESAGVTITPTRGLITSESRARSFFTVVLDAQPTADVVIRLSSKNPDEGAVSPASLTFTTHNWKAPQTVTVTGVDDTVPDGNQPYTIEIAQPESTDERYSRLDPPDVELINVDNDTAGITVWPHHGLVTAEDGSSATFTVVLNSMPSGEVIVDMASGTPSEGVVHPRQLVFTSTNWNAPQTVTVTGQDDMEADGNAAYGIYVGLNPSSADPSYAALPEWEVALTNLDDDSPAVHVEPTSDLVTSEAGASGTFTVVLRSKPSGNVKIDLASSNSAEGVVAPASVTFTTLNYAAPQTVRVTGINDDGIRDGNQRYRIITLPAVSADEGYNTLDAADVVFTNLDDDAPGVTIIPARELTTTEIGGTATFAVRLNSAPQADVTIRLTSTNPAEGEPSPSRLTFTPANWSAPQSVTVTGKDDQNVDGAQPYRIVTAPATSTDPGYQDLDGPDVTAINIDDDTPGITISPAGPLVTTEGGGTATFAIALNSPPQERVNLLLLSSRPGEGAISPSTLVFTSSNWRSPHVVTVTGVDDGVADGHQPYFVITTPTSSTDANYNNLNAPDIPVVNIDNESPGLTVAGAAGLTTSERGALSAFRIVLSAKPAADVPIRLRSSRPAEGTVSPESVTFTPVDWNSPRTITVTGKDDMAVDGPQPYAIVIDSPTGDPAYGDIAPVNIVNLDDDSAGIRVIAAARLTTTETQGTASFGVVLNAPPTGKVDIPIASNNPAEGSVSRSVVTFTPANWASPQIVTVTGVDDDVADGDVPYRVVLGAASSTADARYNGMDADDVALVNADNDAPGIRVSPARGPTSESGGTTTFAIVLDSRPTGNVTIPIVSGRAAEGVPSVAQVVFTPGNWAAPQLVTVQGRDDQDADGDQIYKILFGAAESADASYRGKTIPGIEIVNLDDDAPAIRVIAPPELRTAENGATATFAVVLGSVPSADVTIPLATRNAREGVVSSPASSQLVFTPVNWNMPQTVTVTGVDDGEADGNAVYTVQLLSAISTDPGYSGRDADDVSLVNVDNDSAGITLRASPDLSTTEAGGTASFQLVLNMAPVMYSVTIPLRSSNPAEGTPSHAWVTFTPDNWNVPQTVTITGQQDTAADGNQVYWIVTEPSVSSDPAYFGIDIDDILVTNIDDEGLPPPARARATRSHPAK